MPGRWRPDTPFGDYHDGGRSAAMACGLTGDGNGKKRGESFVFVDDDSDDEHAEDQVCSDGYGSCLALLPPPTLRPPYDPECWNRIRTDVWLGMAAGSNESKTLPLRNSMSSPSVSPWAWVGTSDEPWIGHADEGTSARKRRRKSSGTVWPQQEEQAQISARDFEYIDFDVESSHQDDSQTERQIHVPALEAASNVPPSIWDPSTEFNKKSRESNHSNPGYNYVSLSEALLKIPANRTRLLSTSTSSYAHAAAHDGPQPPKPFLATNLSQSIDLDVGPDSPSPSPPPTTIAADTQSHQQHRHRKRRSSPTPSSTSCAISIATCTTYPSSLSNQYQPFTHPLTGLNMVMGYNTSLPKSRLDMYITAMRQLTLVAKAAEVHPLRNETQRAISAEGVLWAVREAWPAAEGYWNLTATFRGFLAAEQWRNFPSERTYRSLPPAYRPTRAQLTVPHSPMIDWLPWPDVRDLAIRYQDEIDLDALFRVAIHNVVAHRKRRRRLGPINAWPHGGGGDGDGDGNDQGTGQGQGQDKTSFYVWDLVCLEKANGTDPLAEPGLDKKPVPRSPGVKAVLRAYDLEYDDFDTQKLDDGFWEAFPALYCDTAASGWKVQGFPGLGAVDVGRPASLTGEKVGRLRSRLEGVFGGEIRV